MCERRVLFFDDDDDNNELFLWYDWPTKSVEPYFQPWPLSEILTIANLRHASRRVWACAEPEFRLSWMKFCSSDNHYTTAPLDKYLVQDLNLNVYKCATATTRNYNLYFQLFHQEEVIWPSHFLAQTAFLLLNVPQQREMFYENCLVMHCFSEINVWEIDCIRIYSDNWHK